MKFLVDNQLPDALCRFLNARGHESGHVLGLNIDEATDLEIWNCAAGGNFDQPASTTSRRLRFGGAFYESRKVLYRVWDRT